MAFLRILLALLDLASKAAYFGPAHRMLPAKARLASFGFASLLVAFVLASILRYGVVAGQPIDWTTVGFFVAFILWVGVARAAEACLYMAASIGVDLTFAALGALGVAIETQELRAVALVWEITAALVAIVRLHKERERGVGTGR